MNALEVLPSRLRSAAAELEGEYGRISRIVSMTSGEGTGGVDRAELVMEYGAVLRLRRGAHVDDRVSVEETDVEDPDCSLCGRPVPLGTALVFGSVGQEPQHKRCVERCRKAVTG